MVLIFGHPWCKRCYGWSLGLYFHIFWWFFKLLASIWIRFVLFCKTMSRLVCCLISKCFWSPDIFYARQRLGTIHSSFKVGRHNSLGGSPSATPTTPTLEASKKIICYKIFYKQNPGQKMQNILGCLLQSPASKLQGAAVQRRRRLR